jgi:hypothetical protein
MLLKKVTRGYSWKRSLVGQDIASAMTQKHSRHDLNESSDLPHQLKPLVICGPPCSGKVSFSLLNFSDSID